MPVALPVVVIPAVEPIPKLLPAININELDKATVLPLKIKVLQFNLPLSFTVKLVALVVLLFELVTKFPFNVQIALVATTKFVHCELLHCNEAVVPVNVNVPLAVLPLVFNVPAVF